MLEVSVRGVGGTVIINFRVRDWPAGQPSPITVTSIPFLLNVLSLA